MNILHHNPSNLSKTNIKIPISANSVYWLGSEEVEKIFEFLPSRSKISFQKRTVARIYQKNFIFCSKFIGEFKATKILDIGPLDSELSTFYRCGNFEKLT